MNLYSACSKNFPKIRLWQNNIVKTGLKKLRLANMEAWDKHLEQNPNKKIWAEANPKMASVEREKYNRKNPQQKVSIPVYEETLRYMRYFVHLVQS